MDREVKSVRTESYYAVLYSRSMFRRDSCANSRVVDVMFSEMADTGERSDLPGK